MNLEQKITSWDGKSSADINTIYSLYCDDNGFIATIIELAQKEPLQKGVTWLLKRHLEGGHKIEVGQTDKLVALLPTLNHWETKLHILQSLPYIKIVNTQKKEIECFLRSCLADDNKFVRAWAYNGFYDLSMQHSEYTTEIK